MRLFISGRWARALFCAFSTAALSSSASAAFLTVIGGPTYSPSSSGYTTSNSDLESRPTTVEPPVSHFGDVNNAGVAVGSFIRIDAPLPPTPVDVRQIVVRWSATQSPTTLASPGTASFQVHGINDAGTILGTQLANIVLQRSSTGTATYIGSSAVADGVAWSASGVFQQFNSVDATATRLNLVYALNAQGVAVGIASKSGNGYVAARWDAAGGVTELDNAFTSPNPTSNQSLAFAINSSGTAVGRSGYTNQMEPTLWNAGGTAATLLGNLGTPVGKSSIGFATAINDVGTVAGQVLKYDATGTELGYRPVRWDAGSTTPTELGTPSPPVGRVDASVIGINSAGTILGNAATSGIAFALQALRWDAGATQPVALQPLNGAGGKNSFAYDINSSGLAVGTSTINVTFPAGLNYVGGRAVYWGANGIPVDLNSLIDPASGWFLKTATAISDTGWIFGIGQYDPDGAGGQAAYDRAFILQVPEPSAMVLAAFGGVAAFALRQRVRPA
jgi:hypothetical protein